MTTAINKEYLPALIITPDGPLVCVGNMVELMGLKDKKGVPALFEAFGATEAMISAGLAKKIANIIEGLDVKTAAKFVVDEDHAVFQKALYTDFASGLYMFRREEGEGHMICLSASAVELGEMIMKATLTGNYVVRVPVPVNEITLTRQRLHAEHGWTWGDVNWFYTKDYEPMAIYDIVMGIVKTNKDARPPAEDDVVPGALTEEPKVADPRTASIVKFKQALEEFLKALE